MKNLKNAGGKTAFIRAHRVYWKVETDEHGWLTVKKVWMPVANMIVKADIPAMCIFIAYDLNTNVIKYLIPEHEFENAYGVMCGFEFEK